MRPLGVAGAGGTGGPDEEPAGPSSTRAMRGNLPLELSSFVGRERELSEVERLLAGTRLLSLTGTGGCGKTRLALKVAGNLVGKFDDGVWWVGLAPLSDPALAPKSVASALGVRERPGRQMMETLSDHLGSRKMLLILDNCEHLIGACATLAEALLRTCPDLKILATTREPLGIAGEANWPVPSLSVPAAHPLPPVHELVRYEAVGLFVERAAEAGPGFEPTEHNAPAVVRVCRKLEGVPLAIELAAARTKVLTVEQIADRLGDSFGLLTEGSRTALPHQRTLRATVDWSHGLLSEGERDLFQRLSVFAGGFTLEAAEEVCSGRGIEQVEVLPLLSRLVDKSLVVTEVREEHVRYRLLEAIRQYGEEKLRESGGASSTRQRHAGYFLALAEEAEPEMSGPDQAACVERIQREHDNLRAALGWLEAAGDAERGLRLAAALLRFWWFRGHIAEGRARLEVLLDIPGKPVEDGVRARALYTLGVLTYRHADDAAGDWDTARSRLEEGLEIFRGLGDEAGTAATLQELGRVLAELGEWTRAHSLLDESLEIGRRLDDENAIAFSLFTLGRVYWLRDQRPSARALFDESFVVFRKLDDRFWINACLVFLGYIDCEEGDYASALSRFAEMNETVPVIRFPWGATYMLDGYARLAAAQGQAARALRLGGATDMLRQIYGVSIGPRSEALFRRSLRPAWQALGEKEGMAAWEEGRSTSLEEAVALALEGPGTTPGSPSGTVLSVREVEVLSCVAGGLTDVQVAERLYLSRHTVGHHLSSVYRKLGVRGRTAAVHKAGEMGLI